MTIGTPYSDNLNKYFFEKVPDFFFVKTGCKELRFIRTCTGRFFEITGCQPDRYGVLKDAKQVSPDLAASSATKRKASKIRKLRKEVLDV
jgi:hypothetical protein